MSFEVTFAGDTAKLSLCAHASSLARLDFQTPTDQSFLARSLEDLRRIV